MITNLYSYSPSFTVERDGTYLLVARGSNNESVDYSFNLISPKTTTQSQPLTLEETVTSSISQPKEEDIYTFTADEGQTLYFDGISGDDNIDAYLISPSGQNLLGYSNLIRFNPQVVNKDSSPKILTESGTYQLKVDGSGDTTGDYSFRLLDTANATDLTIDELIAGTLSNGMSTDLFAFNATAGQQFYLDGQATNYDDGNYYIYSPRNRYLDDTNFRFDLEFIAPENGTYLIAARGAKDESIDYSFNLISPEISTTSLTLGETIASNINKPGEKDLYTFTADVGQKLYFDGILDNSTSTSITFDGFADANIFASLTSPSGQSLFNYNFKVDDNSEPITLIERGTYQLEIDGGGDATGDYSFRLSNVIQAQELNFNSTIADTLETNTSKVYKFTGTKNQNISFEDLGSDSNGTFRLFGPGNQSIISSSFDSNFETTLPGTGIYTLVLDNSSNDPAKYNFRVV